MTPEEVLRRIYEAFNDQGGSYWADNVLRTIRDTMHEWKAGDDWRGGMEEAAEIARTHEWYIGGIGTKAPGGGEAKSIHRAIIARVEQRGADMLATAPKFGDGK